MHLTVSIYLYLHVESAFPVFMKMLSTQVVVFGLREDEPRAHPSLSSNCTCVFRRRLFKLMNSISHMGLVSQSEPVPPPLCSFPTHWTSLGCGWDRCWCLRPRPSELWSQWGSPRRRGFAAPRWSCWFPVRWSCRASSADTGPGGERGSRCEFSFASLNILNEAVKTKSNSFKWESRRWQ